MRNILLAWFLIGSPAIVVAQVGLPQGQTEFLEADTPSNSPYWTVTYKITTSMPYSDTGETPRKGGNKHKPLCVPHDPCDHGAQCPETTPDIDARSNTFVFEAGEATTVAASFEASVTTAAEAGVTGGKVSVSATAKFGASISHAVSSKVGQTMGLTAPRFKCKTTQVNMHWNVNLTGTLELVYKVKVRCSASSVLGLQTTVESLELIYSDLKNLVATVTAIQDDTDYEDDCRCEELYWQFGHSMNDSQDRSDLLGVLIEVPSNGAQFAYVTAGGYAVELANQTGRGTLVGSIPGLMLDEGGLSYTTMNGNLTSTGVGTLSGPQLLAALGQGGGQTTAYTTGGSTASPPGLAPGGVYYWQTPAYQNSMANLQNQPGYYANTPGYQNLMGNIQNSPGYYANTPAYQNSPLSGLPPSLVGPALTLPTVQQFFGVTPGGYSPGSP